MGKGSTPRPFDIDAATFADNWNRIFGAKPEGSSDKGPHCKVQGENNGIQERTIGEPKRKGKGDTEQNHAGG